MVFRDESFILNYHNCIIKPLVTSFALVIFPTLGFYTNAVLLNHFNSKPPLSKKMFKALLSKEMYLWYFFAVLKIVKIII